ncbi:MAG: inner membrane protein YjcH [Nitrospirae bacterium]|nr:MAG: inner membrane protein YjcH [Nitrospirota bacterium]
MQTDRNVTKMLEDPEFRKLTRQKNRVSLILTIVEMIVFFGFITLLAFYKPFLGTKISGAITVGIPIAVGAIILSWVLTGVYVFWANTKYDAMVRSVRDRIGG